MDRVKIKLTMDLFELKAQSALLTITMADWTECMNFGKAIARQARKVGVYTPQISKHPLHIQTAKTVLFGIMTSAPPYYR